ncbi:MAG TPA: hypothetical protein VFA70_15470 [Dehalococcoidia bacterium]|nr:hypothetical protein [Dehalococcoidia bacterium]
MSFDRRMAVALTLGLFASAVWAQDAKTAAADDQAATPAAQAAHSGHRHHAARSHRAGFDYRQCVKENLADAEYFCSTHPGAACDAEKKGAVKQCKEEARGVRFSG